METALTKGEQTRLTELEEVFEEDRLGFVRAGNALAAIRDENLYHDVADTFDAYCRIRWDLSRQYAYRLIDAAQVVETVSPIGDIAPPQNEAQARELTKLASEQEQATAWTRAVETAPVDDEGEPVVTAKHVASVVRGMVPTREPSKKQREKEARKRGLAAVGVLVRVLEELGASEVCDLSLEGIKEFLSTK